MKQIKQITLYAFIIAAIILFYTYPDACKMELSRFASFCIDDVATQKDNDEGSSVNYSNVYASNNNLDGIENNYSETPIVTANNTYTKADIATESSVSNNVSNENPINNTISYHENKNSNINEHGPNNNYQDVTSINIPNNEPSTVNQHTETKSSSNSSLSNEVDATTEEITPNNNSSFAPPSPGSGGQDPFSVPIDDFYGLFFLLITSIIFGVVSIKKMKLI